MATHDSQNGNGSNTDSDPEQGAVEQLIKILNALYSATEALKPYASSDMQVPESINDSLRDARNELVLWCEGHLKNNLKAIMLRAFGPQIAKEGSLRFTVLWNDVLFKMLSSGRLKAPEGDVIQSLTSYFSTALANQARNYLKRRKRFGEILDDAIKPLVEQRERYLKENYDIDIELLLEKVDEWENAGEKLGKALRLRYIDGMTYDQIAESLELSRDQVKRTLAEGKERLKNIANRS